MTRTDRTVDFAVYPPERQGSGGFDGGRITEMKPIGFPGEGSAVTRIGPLFYWAWATSQGYGKIGLHPHGGFEIMSYVLDGEIGHRDTLGTVSQVKTGGAQVMQTGSGISHEEEFFGSPTDMFQIWFEPELGEAVKRAPSYREIHHKDFPVIQKDGIREKQLIGERAPVSLVADAMMQDVIIEPGICYQRRLLAGKNLAVVAISGKGAWKHVGCDQQLAVQARDFAVIQANEDATISVSADSTQVLRLAIIEVPREVHYPLYAR